MDGTLESKDASLVGDSSGTPKETSTDTQTYTKETQEKAVSDALSTAGRDAKVLETKGKELDARTQSLQSRETGLTEWEKRKDEAELEAAKDDPELSNAIKVRQTNKATQATLAEERANLERDKTQHAAELEVVNATKRDKAIGDIATKYGVDPVALKGLNLDNIDQIEAVAKAMVKPTEGVKPLVSGITTGGGASSDSARGKIREGWDELHKSK